MSLQACAEIVERGDPDRFLAAMAAPVGARAVLFPLYAFNVEVARAPWVTQESMIAEMRLQWWRDALKEIGSGELVRRHEVTQPLAEILDAEGATLLDQLVQARRWDIYCDPFEDAAHFSEYLDRTSGNLVWTAARALGCRESEAAVRDVAWASGLANWLMAVRDLRDRGRVPLVDASPQAIRALAKQGLDRLRAARRHDFGEATSVLRAGWRAKSLLKQAAQQPERVANGTLGTSEVRRRASLIWKAAVDGW